MHNDSRGTRFVMSLLLGWSAMVGVFNGASARPPLQQTPTTFSARVDLIEVDAYVEDHDGRALTGLTSDDFEILEDGQRQLVSTCDYVRLGRSGGQPGNVHATASVTLPPSDVRTTAEEVLPRFYVLMLDDVHTTRFNSAYLIVAATRFVQQWVEAGDLVAVVYASGKGRLSLDFTADKTRMLAAIDHFQGFAAGQTQSALGTISAVANELAGIKGRRKTCVYFSQGFAWSRSAAPFRDMIAAANRANLNIYTVSVEALASLANAVSAHVPSVVQGTARPSTEGELATVAGEHGGLRYLAETTGGFSVVEQNDLDAGFDRIRRESSSYYLLRYYPGTQPQPGSEHRLEVRLKNRPGTAVRARPSYVVPLAAPHNSRGSELAADLVAALKYPVFYSDVKMTLAATAFHPDVGAPWAVVTIDFDGATLTLPSSEALEVVAASYDSQGASLGRAMRLADLRFEPEVQDRVKRKGLRVQMRVPLAVGGSTVRVAAKTRPSNRRGSLWIDIGGQNPNARLALSGIALSHSLASGVPAAGVDEELRDALGAPVSANRHFLPNEEIAWLAEVYPSGSASEPTTTLTTTITAVDTGQETLRTQQKVLANRTIRVVQRAELRDHRPGRYVLRIDASCAGASPASTAVAFWVEGEREEGRGLVRQEAPASSAGSLLSDGACSLFNLARVLRCHAPG